MNCLPLLWPLQICPLWVTSVTIWVPKENTVQQKKGWIWVSCADSLLMGFSCGGCWWTQWLCACWGACPHSHSWLHYTGDASQQMEPTNIAVKNSWRMGQEPSIRKLLPLWAHPCSQIWLVVSIFFETSFPGRMAEEAVLRSLMCWAYRMWSSPAFGARSSYPRMAQALNLNLMGVLFWAGTLLVEMAKGRCGWLGWDTWRKAEFPSFHDPAYSEAST